MDLLSLTEKRSVFSNTDLFLFMRQACTRNSEKTTFNVLQCEYSDSGLDISVNTDLVLRNWGPIRTSGLRPSVHIGPHFLRTLVRIHRYVRARVTVFPHCNTVKNKSQCSTSPEIFQCIPTQEVYIDQCKPADNSKINFAIIRRFTLTNVNLLTIVKFYYCWEVYID